MRLLNAQTLKLHSFQEGKTPNYVILSHTWEDEEVLFEDLQDMAQASKKAGFAKIQFCCKQALDEDIEYVWVDTCCIDKTSSTELSEAINSMYRWYQKAKVCFAYLSDIIMPAAIRLETSEMEIGGSRWFKRAWTLQELLAPPELVFYSHNWTEIGNRLSLTGVISTATGIDKGYLAGKPLKRASIAKRMSWAANREATRAEDIAYSLFGIFGVHMPLLYGEGDQNAFMRLQEEIMKYSDDHTLFAWGISKDSSRHLNFIADGRVLAPSPAYFVESRDLIPIENTNQLAPYSMTNIGLRISLPLDYELTPTAEVVMAALNCRNESDFFHVIALPLHHVGSKQFIRQPQRSPTTLRTSILSRYSLQEIFIRDKAVESVNADRHLAFIFRDRSPLTEIRGVYPPEYWFSKDEFLQGPEQKSPKKSWHACLHLEIKTGISSRNLLLVFGVDFNEKSPRVATEVFQRLCGPWDEQNTVAHTWCALRKFPQGDKTLGQLHGNFQKHPKIMGRHFCEDKGIRISLNEATARERESPDFMYVMGEYMCVVDITVDSAKEKIEG
ncbi:HET-domain-containing protein [Stipitochalara longipes BDJ]|nr:HET-domain-containing protein [Stipitochalara longipes BDJ]